MLKTYNQSNIEQLSVCTIKLRHKDKCIKCRFFVIPDDCPALIGMPDIELLSKLGIMCGIIGRPHETRKFDSQTIDI